MRGSFESGVTKMRRALSGIACIYLELSAAFAQEPSMRVDIGETVMVELWERPSTGRRWRIDREASDRLDMVEIRDLGFVPRRRIGAPGSRLFRIEAVGEGTARIIFLREAPTPSRRFTLVLETL